MFIENEIELFKELNLLSIFNSLLSQLFSLGISLSELAQAEFNNEYLFDYLQHSWVDYYNQTYTYGCLYELQSAFYSVTNKYLYLTWDDSKQQYKFYIMSTFTSYT